MKQKNQFLRDTEMYQPYAKRWKFRNCCMQPNLSCKKKVYIRSI